MSRGDALARLRQALEDHGSQVRGGGAQCPAHDDARASLSVSQGKTGAILHCHAGCPTDAVLEALGLSAADLFDEPRDTGRRDDAVIATYCYTDERGTPLFYVERRAGKQFRQYQITGDGGRVWNLNGVRRVPYRLPELLDAAWAGEVIYVAEGEKDVDAIRAAGGVATCNPGGAGKWRAEYARYFDGPAQVLVIADRDEPGREHAAQVAGSLRGAAPCEVEIVEAAKGKDASDHLAAGFGLDQFRPSGPGTPRVSADERNETNEKSLGDPPPVADPAMYRGILGEITAEAAPTTEADPPGIYASLQAGAGVLAGGKPYVQIGNLRHPLLIWALLIGRTGSGRKGEATGVSEVFLRRAAVSTFDKILVAGLSSGEGLIEQIRDDGPRGGDRRLLVTETEFSSVMARSQRDGNTLAAVSRQAWEGRALSVMNRKQLKASSSHIAVIGHVAPREFRSRMADTDLAGGTYNRYLPVYVERSKLLAIPEPVGEPVLARLGARLGDAIARAGDTGRIQLGRDARSLWEDELYPEFADLDDAGELSWSEFTRRAAPYSLRLAGLHAALDGRDLISKDDLAAAGAQVRYSVASAKYALSGIHRDPRLNRLTRAVTEAGQAGLTRTQVSALFSRNLTAAALDDLLGKLAADDGYEVIRPETGGRGRPADTYRRISFV